jgi:hypothetical protein
VPFGRYIVTFRRNHLPLSSGYEYFSTLKVEAAGRTVLILKLELVRLSITLLHICRTQHLLWDVILYVLLVVYGRFGETCSLHVHDLK